MSQRIQAKDLIEFLQQLTPEQEVEICATTKDQKIHSRYIVNRMTSVPPRIELISEGF